MKKIICLVPMQLQNNAKTIYISQKADYRLHGQNGIGKLLGRYSVNRSKYSRAQLYLQKVMNPLLQKVAWTLAAVALCSLGLAVGTVQSEENSQGYSYGKVTTISANSIVIKEADYESEQEVELSFVINAETDFENASSASDISKGDEVEVTFKQVEGQKIAVLISKEETWTLPDEDLWEDSDDDAEKEQ